MSESEVIEIQPHEQVLLMKVLPRRLDAAAATQLEHDVSLAAIEQPNKPLVLDLVNVKFAPSVALGVFVNMLKGFDIAKRKTYFIGVNHQLRGTLAVTRLDAMITVREKLADVLREI